MTAPQKLGKYDIVREIGAGGMGVVYEGHDPLIDRRVALKIVKSAQLDAADQGMDTVRAGVGQLAGGSAGIRIAGSSGEKYCCQKDKPVTKDPDRRTL